jgi:LysM repeat protein
MNISFRKIAYTTLLTGVFMTAHTAQAVSCWKGVCTVEAGDTVYQIAQEMDTSWQSVLKGNNINSPAELQVGQKLRMDLAFAAEEKLHSQSTDSETEASESQAENETKTETGPAQYTVKIGDTLFSIMRATDVYWKKIAQDNHITPPYILTVGKILKLSPNLDE